MLVWPGCQALPQRDRPDAAGRSCCTQTEIIRWSPPRSACT